MKEFNKELGTWLAEKRREAGFTQQQVADRMGSVKSRICNWEKGIRSMDAEDLFNYCEVIRADLNEFVLIASRRNK